MIISLKLRKKKFNQGQIEPQHIQTCLVQTVCLALTLICRGFRNPVKVSDDRLQEASGQFACGVLNALKSP